MTETIDWGPLDPIMKDLENFEVMVNAPDSIFLMHKWRWREEAGVTFNDERHLMQTVDSILKATGQKLDAASPITDVRLEDGTRIQIIIPPASSRGATLYILRPRDETFKLEDGIPRNLAPNGADFLRACVKAHVNMILFGGYRSGKTTMLNALANVTPELARVIVVQEGSDLSLTHKNRVMLETRPPDFEGKGEIPMHYLLEMALKMRPDRLVISELHGDAAPSLLSALSIGYDAMWSMHAANARDAITRMEQMASAANLAMPLLTLREQIGTAAPVLVHVDLDVDTFQRVLHISEVQGLVGDSLIIKDLFHFEADGGKDDVGANTGTLVPTGIIPKAMEKIRDWKVDLPEGLFTVS